MYYLDKLRRNNYMSGLFFFGGGLFYFGSRYRKYNVVRTLLVNGNYKHDSRITRLSNVVRHKL